MYKHASNSTCLPQETERVCSCNLDPYTDEKGGGREGKVEYGGRDNVMGGRVGGLAGTQRGTDRKGERERRTQSGQKDETRSAVEESGLSMQWSTAGNCPK